MTTVTDLPPNPFNHHQDDEMMFSSLPMPHEFDDGDFDSLLNLDAVGETFNFDDGVLDGGLQGELAGDVEWMGVGAGATLTTAPGMIVEEMRA
jgi:hypothetical protein